MMNRLLIKRLFFAFTPVYAPYCPPFAKKNESYDTIGIATFVLFYTPKPLWYKDFCCFNTKD